uniref:Delta(14)-sterol reductase TM7SF2 n=1 Tax=Petromyzon marinus TaxID=7757 RepID=S4R4L3_PETMA
MVHSKFTIGEEVMARWPGSCMWYKVQVLSYSEESSIYNVKYEDGTELELETSSIKKIGSFRTPRKSRSRSRSRSRSKSPGRRSNSPGRRPRARSPIRSPKVNDKEAKSSRATKPEEEPVQTTTNHTAVMQVPQAITKVKEISKEKNGAETGKQAAVVVKEKAMKEEKEMKKKKMGAVASESSPLVIYRLRSRQGINQPKETPPVELPKLSSKPEEICAEPGLGVKLDPAAVCGSAGTALLPLALPLALLYVLHVCCSDGCSLLSPPAPPPGLASLWDMCTLVLCLGWCLFQALLCHLPLGYVTERVPPNTEQRLKYRLNGIHALVLSISAFSLAKYKEAYVAYVHDKFLQLAVSAVLLAYLLSAYLFVRARCASHIAVATTRRPGNIFYDFFFGRELNPRIGNMDLKSFFELRPGFIGWAIISLVMVLEDLQKNEAFSPALLLYVALQFIYVADVLWNEERSLSTGDIPHKYFGFLLAFTNLAWIPFASSLPAYYLVHHHQELTAYWAAAICLLYLVGYVISRRAHTQKNAQSDSAGDRGKPADSRSSPVLGSWGRLRHPELLGELLMLLAWSLPCGFSHPLPYIPVVYSLVMLLHREAR